MSDEYTAAPPEPEGPPQNIILPPYSREAEEALVGSVLIDPEVLRKVDISANQFHLEHLGWIWSAMQRLDANGVTPDFVILTNELETQGLLNQAGGPAYLAQLLNATPSALHAEHYAAIVRENAERRAVLGIANLLGKAAYLDPGALEHARAEAAAFFSRNGHENPDILEMGDRFQVRTAADALQPQPPIEWIIEKLFSAGSIALIVGPPGSKKTYAMIDAGVCAAIGRNWLDFPTRRSKVLFVDEESGDRRMARRLGEVLRGQFGNETTPFDYLSLAQFNLRDPAEAILLQALIEQTGAQLVIIDALADIMPGADENAVKDVHPVFMRLRKIAEDLQVAIVVIHHANKAGDYRGSTAISGAVDLLLMVESKEDSPNIDFETKKARDVEPFRFSAQAHFSDGQTWLTATGERQKRQALTRAQKWVINYLKDHGPSTRMAITSSPDTCSSRAASDAIYQLADRKLIRRANPGEAGQGTEAIYGLVEEDEDESFPNIAPDEDAAKAARQQLDYERENGLDLGV